MVRVQEDIRTILRIMWGRMMLKCKNKILVSDTTSDLLASNLKTNLNLYKGIAYILSVLDTAIF